MRCPKCGFISFDRQKSCGKCANDLTAIAAQLRGTTLRGVTPFFLGGVMVAPETTAALADLPMEEENDLLTMDPLMVDDFPPAEEELDLDLGAIIEEVPDSTVDFGALALMGATNLDLDSLDSIMEEEPKKPAEAAMDLDLDLAGAPLEEEPEEAPPSLGLDGIDVSDLLPPMPPQLEEEMGFDLSLDAEEEPLPPADEPEEAQAALEIDLPSLQEVDIDLMAVEEPASNSTMTDDDEIVDLSLFMEAEPPVASDGASSEAPVDLDLSLEADEDHSLTLSLEEFAEPASPPTNSADNNANQQADIPDLGLTMEMEEEGK